MTRVSQTSIIAKMMIDMQRTRGEINEYSQEISTGYKASKPGDTKHAATIAQLRDNLVRIEEHSARATNVLSYLQLQEEVLGEANDVMIRAQELAQQGANETLSESERQLLADEVFQLRDHLVQLANTQFNGRYIYSGAADNAPAFSLDGANAFTSPATGDATDFYAYNSNSGSADVRNVRITDELTVQVNTSGDALFGGGIRALTQLGRSLEGYDTVYTGNPPVPDQALSVAYNFPADYTAQSQDIQNVLDTIDSERTTQMVPERTNVAARMRRVQTAASLLEISETSAKEVLSNLQEADLFQSATELTQAQTTLQASLSVTTQLLQQSILNYI